MMNKQTINNAISKHYQGKDYIKINWKMFKRRQAKRLMDFNNRCIIYLNRIKHGDDIVVNMNNYHKTLVTLKKIEEDGLKWRFRKYDFLRQC